MPAGVTEHAGHGPKYTPTLVKPGRHDGGPAVMCPLAGGHEKSPLDDVGEQAGGVHDGGCGGEPRYNGQSDWSRVWAGSGSPVISCRRIRPTVLRGMRRACPICAWVMPWAR